jgi:hypothetical protein
MQSNDCRKCCHCHTWFNGTQTRYYCLIQTNAIGTGDKPIKPTVDGPKCHGFIAKLQEGE